MVCRCCRGKLLRQPQQSDPCSVCTLCGNVLDEAAFATDVTFTKGPGGESAVDGQRVSEAGVARGMGRIAGGRVYGHQVRQRAPATMLQLCMNVSVHSHQAHWCRLLMRTSNAAGAVVW